MDLARSESFIEQCGSGLEKARARCILHHVKPEPDVLRSIAELQNEDGETHDVGATIETLKVLQRYAAFWP